MKFFKSVRANRNETLLEVLGAVATSKNPVSRPDIQERLRVRSPGVRRKSGQSARTYVYSSIHTNTRFLEQKDFLRITQTRARKEKLYEVTVKGALASLFSSFINETNAPMWLETWRKKDWGPGYDQPFANVKDVSELKKIAETLTLPGVSLEDVSEDILKRNLRDPEDLQSLIREAVITVTKRIDKEGKYLVPIRPDQESATFCELRDKTNAIKGLALSIVPDLGTSKILYDLVTSDPSLKKTLQTSFLTILKTLTYDFKKKGEGGSIYSYFSNLRTAVLTLTIPEKVASLLHYPQRIAEYTQKSFDDIVRPFLQNPDFVEGKSWFNFYARRYDPERRDLLDLSTREIKEKSYNLLKQLHGELDAIS